MTPDAQSDGDVRKVSDRIFRAEQKTRNCNSNHGDRSTIPRNTKARFLKVQGPRAVLLPPGFQAMPRALVRTCLARAPVRANEHHLAPVHEVVDHLLHRHLLHHLRGVTARFWSTIAPADTRQEL